MTTNGVTPSGGLREVQTRHPAFVRAVLEDARVAAAFRAERHVFRSPLDAWLTALRLAWVSDAFLAQLLYRVKATLQAHRVPFLPRLFHRAAMALAQVCIGDPVVMRPGVYINHGQVVIDGFTEIHGDVVIAPWVTIGVLAGDFQGPVIGPGVHIGTGAKILGPIHVASGAQVGANAVVLADVPAGATVVGVPARVVDRADQ